MIANFYLYKFMFGFLPSISIRIVISVRQHDSFVSCARVNEQLTQAVSVSACVYLGINKSINFFFGYFAPRQFMLYAHTNALTSTHTHCRMHAHTIFSHKNVFTNWQKDVLWAPYGFPCLCTHGSRHRMDFRSIFSLFLFFHCSGLPFSLVSL